QAAGGTLNVVTRSGGNEFTGRLYGFARNDAWDATPALVDSAPPLREYRVGATAGGPLVANRLFYFTGLERLDIRSSNVVRSSFASANGSFPSLERQLLGLVRLDALATPNHHVRMR